MFFYILLASFLTGFVSLFLALLLLLNKKLAQKISFSLVSVAAGALLATAFLEIIPEAVELEGNIFALILSSMVLFFIIERLFIFLHHHEEEDRRLMPAREVLFFGDAMHNFIDGVAIAGAFLVSFEVGLVTSLAVFIHEIPHEIGDLGILLQGGMERGKILLFNLSTEVFSLAGAISAFIFAQSLSTFLPVILAFTAGNFIYLSATDLIPEIHRKAEKSLALNQTLLFLLGIILIFILTTLLQ